MPTKHPLNDISLTEEERNEWMSRWVDPLGRKVHKFLLVNRPTPAREATMEAQALAGREAIGYDFCMYAMLTLGLPEKEETMEDEDARELQRVAAKKLSE